MTPAALEVLLDAARDGGATEEEVARVRWTMDRTSEELARAQRWAGESEFERLLGAWVELTTPPWVDHACVDCVGVPEAGRWGSGDWRCLWHRARALRRVLLSRPENSTGASAPSPQGETP